MKPVWQLQEAKSKFSQVVDRALQEGPQIVSRRGVETVIILSMNDYQKLTSYKQNFKEYLLNCPKLDQDIQFERPQDRSRNMDF